jgi:hypothetical protein
MEGAKQDFQRLHIRDTERMDTNSTAPHKHSYYCLTLGHGESLAIFARLDFAQPKRLCRQGLSSSVHICVLCSVVLLWFEEMVP